VSCSSSEIAYIQECKEAFETVRSVQELTEQTIAFLKGETAATSYHFGPLLAESTPLVEKLVQLNRLGLITTGSQPGGEDRYQGARVEKRFFVEGILKRRHLALFLQRMYQRLPSQCFIALPETDFSYEEICELEAADVYWVQRQGKRRGLLHITELNGPCQMFQTCDEIYAQLVDEYVSVFIMDTRWCHAGTEVLDAAIAVLQDLAALPGLSTRTAPMNIYP
jgi:hypothetical protein